MRYRVFEFTGRNWETGVILETNDWFEAIQAMRSHEHSMMIDSVAGLRWTN